MVQSGGMSTPITAIVPFPGVGGQCFLCMGSCRIKLVFFEVLIVRTSRFGGIGQYGFGDSIPSLNVHICTLHGVRNDPKP